jgi:hypothetical protein
MSVARTVQRNPLAAILLFLLVLLALFGAATASVLLLGTAAKVEPAAAADLPQEGH